MMLQMGWKWIQESCQSMRSNSKPYYVLIWTPNYTYNELPPRGSECPKKSAKSVNGAFTCQECYQKWEKTLALVFNSFRALFTKRNSSYKDKIIAPNQFKRIKGVPINQGRGWSQERALTVVFLFIWGCACTQIKKRTQMCLNECKRVKVCL